jgi:hypothetical protein
MFGLTTMSARLSLVVLRYDEILCAARDAVAKDGHESWTERKTV